MLNGVQNWWAVGSNTPAKSKVLDEEKQKENDVAKSSDSRMASTVGKDDVKNVLAAAKEWGTYFYSMGKVATHLAAQTIKEQAVQVKSSGVTDQIPIISDFSRQQDAFVREKQERRQRCEGNLAPWVGYHDEESLRQKILALSLDTRNFLRNPPAGADFQFDADVFYPVALAILLEDQNLEKMRFQLVPKQIKEELFWRNYFYRVSLIKHSMRLASSTQIHSAQSTDTSAFNKPIESSGVGDSSDSNFVEQNQVLENYDFVSDHAENGTVQNLSREEQQLFDVSQTSSNSTRNYAVEEWEEDLRRELSAVDLGESSSVPIDNEYDAVVNEDELEKEIMAELEAEEN